MRDELDDAIEAELRGHFEASAQKDSELVDSIELPKLPKREMRMPEMDIRPEAGDRVMEMPEMDLRPEAQETVARPGSIPAQVGKSLTAAKMDLSKPMGTRDEELRGAQADAKAKRSFSQLGQAVTDFTERPTNLLDYAMRLGGGGVSAAPKTRMWQENAAEADRGISDLADRRKADAVMETQQSQRAATADDSDPNGQTAQTYRSVLVKFAPELSEQLRGASPKQMRAIAPWLEKFAAENNDLIQAKAAAEAKAAQQAKTDAEKKTALDLAQKNRAEDVADRRANTAATREQTAAALGLRKGEIEKKAADDVKDDVKDLSKALPADLADFDQKAADIQAMIDGANGDIPGVGFFDSKKPAFLRSQKDNEMQKKAGQMQAAYQKLVTGTGGGEKELANLERIGLMLSNEDSFVEGFNALREAYHQKVKQVRSGFATPVLQQYDKNTSREGLGGTVEITDKKGGKYNVPAAEADALKAELRAEGLL